MCDDLNDCLDEVVDEDSFIRFVQALAADRAAAAEEDRLNPPEMFGRCARGWENTKLEDFFEAAIAWARATRDGSNDYTVPENPWKRCAEILYMGKGYE